MGEEKIKKGLLDLFCKERVPVKKFFEKLKITLENKVRWIFVIWFAV